MKVATSGVVGQPGNRHMRNARTKFDQVFEVAHTQVGYSSLNQSHAEDCAMAFLAKKASKEMLTGPLYTDEEMERLHKEAVAFVKDFCSLIRYQRNNETSMTDKDGATVGLAARLVSREPSPEQVAIMADMMRRMLAVLPQLTTEQQRLFVRHFLERKRLVDLREETGRSAGALRIALYTIRKRMQRLLEGEGIDAAEIADFLNMLDRLRSAD